MTFFPMTFVDAIADSMQRNLPDHRVEKRPISPIDPSLTISVFPEDWSANGADRVMGQLEPVLSTYKVTVQNLLISADSSEGRREFSLVSKSVRAILYRDEELRVSLGGLSEEFLGSVERVKKFSVLSQQFMAASLDLGFFYLCKTDIQVETETSIGGAP